MSDFLGTQENDTLIRFGFADNNRIFGFAGNDFLDGGGNDLLLGDAGNDTLEGGSGDDFLEGGSGNDRLSGELGNDTYIVNSANDIITKVANSGFDNVRSFVSFTLPSNVENLTLLTEALNGTGNDLSNDILGNNSNNTLKGGNGGDFLGGFDGNDFLNGSDWKCKQSLSNPMCLRWEAKIRRFRTQLRKNHPVPPDNLALQHLSP